MITLSEDIEIHAAALAAHVERTRAKAAANSDYWHRTIKENLLSQSLPVFSNSMIKQVNPDAAKAHEDLKLPDGRRIGEVKHHELASIFDKLKIPGFSHTLSRSAAIEKYAEHIAPIAKAGADKAVAEWLEKNGS